jgi:hypothetical protein
MPDDLNAAISSAVASSTAEVEGGSDAATTPEPTATTPAATEKSAPAAPAAEKPAAPAAGKPAAVAPPDEDEVFTPTAEELATIDKNPELKKVYRSMQRGLTQKTQSLADMRKALEQKANIVDWIRQDPASALKAISEYTGVNLAKPTPTTEAKVADSLEAKWAEVVGADAATLLRPLFEDTARAILEKEVAPYKAQTEALARTAAERGVAASVREFGATVSERGDEWADDIQGEMAQLAQRIEPGPDTPINEYLDVLYDKVMAGRMRSKSARANLERLRKVRTETEPSNAGRPTPAAEERITSDMNDKDAVAVAVRMARQSLGMR